MLLYKDTETLSMFDVKPFQRKDTLDEFKLVYKELGSPADHYKVIHVTGTNGKGSFCKKTSKALELSGYKVGLYTSPHLVKFTERISINGESISDYDQQRLDWIVQKAFQKHNVTLRRYFDSLTLVAYLYFKENKVDYAVIEGGCGMRYDPTNVIATSELGVITSVDIDHVKLLGNTTELIAENKSDLWRKGKPILIGPNCPQEHIKNYLKTQYDADESLMYFMPKSEDGIYDFNAENNKIVRQGFDILNRNGNVIDPSVIDRALKAKLRGRMEVMTDKIVYDGTHNPNGAEKTVKQFVEDYTSDPNTDLHMVFASQMMVYVMEILTAMVDHPYFKRYSSLIITECKANYHIFGKWGIKCVSIDR